MVSMRCPTCGAELRAVLAPEPPTQWFPCPQCRNPVPFVVPRDLPPLYSWEVLPGLYPALPPPRRPKVRLRRMAQVALAIVVALAVVLAVVLSVLGVEALSPATYDVSGTVMEQGFLREVPAVGATVVMTVNGGAPVRTVTAGRQLLLPQRRGGRDLGQHHPSELCPGHGRHLCLPRVRHGDHGPLRRAGPRE